MRRRVLLVAPQPFFELRGTPINVLQMVRALCGAGYEVHLATYGLGEPVRASGLVHHRALRLPGVRRVAIGFSPQKLVLDALLAGLVWRLLLTRRFDVVHAVEEAIFFTLPLARLRGIPVIDDLDSSISEQLAQSGVVRSGALLSMVRAVERAALRRSQLAITVCGSLTDHVRACAAATPVLQIEDAPLAESLREPDPAVMRRLRERYGMGADAGAGAGTGVGPLVVYTGNLARYQGIDLLIDALPTLAERCPAARVLVVGGAPEEIAAARRVIAQRGPAIERMVIFAGMQPPELMPEFMALATVLVSPRRAGGGANTPLKLYTYMQSGVPIVATDLPTHRQVLDETTAVLAPPVPDALGAALAEVAAHPARYAPRGAAARERVRQRYSPDVFREKLLAGYATLLGGRGARAAAAAVGDVKRTPRVGSVS